MNEGSKIKEEGIYLWKGERKRQNLMPLDLDFFQKASIYLKHLEKVANEDSDVIVRKIFKKLFNRTSYVLNDLITIRLQKIFWLALTNTPINEKLNEEELKTYNLVKVRLNEHRENIFKQRRHEKKAKKITSVSLSNDTSFLQTTKEMNSETVSYCLVLFIDNENDQALGSDLKTYGPFQKGMHAIIPVDNAIEYQSRNKAKIVFSGAKK